AEGPLVVLAELAQALAAEVARVAGAGLGQGAREALVGGPALRLVAQGSPWAGRVRGPGEDIGSGRGRAKAAREVRVAEPLARGARTVEIGTPPSPPAGRRAWPSLDPSRPRGPEPRRRRSSSSPGSCSASCAARWRCASIASTTRT